MLQSFQEVRLSPASLPGTLPRAKLPQSTDVSRQGWFVVSPSRIRAREQSAGVLQTRNPVATARFRIYFLPSAVDHCALAGGSPFDPAAGRRAPKPQSSHGAIAQLSASSENQRAIPSEVHIRIRSSYPRRKPYQRAI